MYLLLVRHGESVDNVAGLLAGSRDAQLTSHGVAQAIRLANHLIGRFPSSSDTPITHLWSSDLRRAAKTADTVFDAAVAGGGDGGASVTAAGNTIERVQIPDLRERDFRSLEGLTHAQATALRASNSISTSYRSPESPAEMEVRASRFIDAYLMPLLQAELADEASRSPRVVVVVSHGIMIGILLLTLEKLAAVTPTSVEGRLMLTNTGYVDLVVKPWRELPSGGLTGLHVKVKTVNYSDHLSGLRRAHGGSSAHDEKQPTIKNFFQSLPRNSG